MRTTHTQRPASQALRRAIRAAVLAMPLAALQPVLAGLAHAADAQHSLRSYDIPAGPLSSALSRFAGEAQMEIEERSFTIREAQQADEAFFTSASSFVMPIVEVDGVKLGSGKPGPVAKRLREIYIEEALKAAI